MMFLLQSRGGLGLLSLALAACAAPAEGDLASPLEPAGGSSSAASSAVADALARSRLSSGNAPPLLEPPQPTTPLDPPQPAPVSPESQCTPGIPPTSQLKRLSKLHYENTVVDLLGLSTLPELSLPPDHPGALDQAGWEAYQVAARALAIAFIGDDAAREQTLPCQEDTEACIDDIVMDLGFRAFRRPLSEAEQARFMALYEDRAAITQNGTLDEILEVIVEGFLVSPSFLMQVEAYGQPTVDGYALTDFEIASRLSYMLWETMPDEVLFESASAGQLQSKDAILAHAYRLLEDERARPMVVLSHQHYLGMTPYSHWQREFERDPELYPDFHPDLVPRMYEETDLFLARVAFDTQGTFQDLLLSTEGFVDAALAPIYGLDPTQFANELTLVDLGENRPGVFTRLAFLASRSNFDSTSPILRGAFLNIEVMALNPGAPTPQGPSTPLPTDPALVTNRMRVEAQTERPECVGCHHTIINPVGFVFEGFDAIGKVQTKENDVAIDTTATVIINADTIVDATGPAELMAQIAWSPPAQRLYAEKLTAYAYGRLPNADDQCIVDELAAMIANGNTPILELYAQLTQTDSFTTRSVAQVDSPSTPSPTNGSTTQPVGDVITPAPPSDTSSPSPNPSTSTDDARNAPANSDGAPGGEADFGGRDAGTSSAEDGELDGPQLELSFGGGCACRTLGGLVGGFSAADLWVLLGLLAWTRRRSSRTN